VEPLPPTVLKHDPLSSAEEHPDRHLGIHRIPRRRFSPFTSCVAHPELKAKFNLRSPFRGVKLSAKIFYPPSPLTVFARS
jgi:hypothetical protein